MEQKDSWRARALQILAYHEEKLGASSDKNWTLRDTGRDLGISASLVFHELRLAKTLRNNPEKLKAARSKTHALQILDTDESIRVELKYARVFITGQLIKIIELDGHDHYLIKLDRPLKTEHFEVQTIWLPPYQCRVIKND